MPDITEIRCNIEVHEQIQHNYDISEEFSDFDDYEFQETCNDYICPNSELDISNKNFDESLGNISLGQNFETVDGYKFSRIAGHHVEVHYELVIHNELLEKYCPNVQFIDVLEFYLNYKKNVCDAVT
ncbi:hypothetical protein TNCV_2049271 [Trichonephila clavipes]|nr:hypothetical protein TNCV_2049271 [Trichonephila clavipes]